MDWEKARASIENGISECARDWCQKKGFHDNYLLGWRKEVMNLVDERINVLKAQRFEQPKETLSHFSSRKCLKNLQSNFVLAPIDKETGNISFICKRFYAKVLLTELGLLGGASKPISGIVVHRRIWSNDNSTS